jgi:eukaryotic-like serine/threonine-protein kinase
MSLIPTSLGPYRVLGKLGEGGMGEVYRARDTKLGREVALKVLPHAVAHDPARIARLEREAQSLAALNHPHIGTLFGMDQDNGRHFIVMELVEGETLEDRVARGALPIDDALRISKQVAEALEAAHERGIVHRDLKPANVKVTQDGVVKVLDFGLAKGVEPAHGAVGNPAQSPTISVLATEAGIILGTAAYMSPEQAKGLPTDHRSDIFSFGCLLYELVTGRRAFPGETATDMLASVLAREPDWLALSPTNDRRVTALLRRCLAKSRRDRWQAIGDVRAEIESILAAPEVREAPAHGRRSPWLLAASLAAVAAFAATAGAWIALARRPVAIPTVTRFQITMLPEQVPATNFNRSVVTISRDGSTLGMGGDRIYLRPLSEAAARPVPRTEGFGSTTHPVFAPDGRSLVFWSQTDRTLKRVFFDNSSVTTLAPIADGGYGVHWSGDTLYVSESAPQGILKLSANGGQPQSIVAVKDREHIYGPQLLPDGVSLLFTLGVRGMTSWDDAKIVVQSVQTGERRTVVERGTDGRYVSSGHLLFARGGSLLAAPFNVATLAVTGDPVAVVEGIRRGAPGTSGVMHYAVSDSGTLVYIEGPHSTVSGLQMAAFERGGAARHLNAPLGPYATPRVSPDGTRVAVVRNDNQDAQVWVYSLATSMEARPISHEGNNVYPVWSPDSQKLAFQSNREGDTSIWWQRADGAGKPTRLTRPQSGRTHIPHSWSRDGKHLLFDEYDDGRVTLLDLSMAGGKIAPFAALASDVQSGATFSPDGKWVAYTMRKINTAQAVVFVEPYPATGARYQISKDGEDGHHPTWSADGNELFYTPGPGNRLTAVSITYKPSFSYGEARPLQRVFVNTPPTVARPYDIMRDGKSFIALRADVAADGRPIPPVIQVVVNWFEELKQRVPIK